MLQDAKPEHTFWLKTGKGVKNIAELGRELKQMNKEVFTHHVNENKNDFAEWTKHCIKDEKLAALLKTTKNQQRAAAIVERRIQELTIPNPVKKQARTQIQPSIVRTKNVTMLSLAGSQIPSKKLSENQTQPSQARGYLQQIKKDTTEQETPKKTIIHAQNKTTLHLSTNKPEIYVHEIKPHHYSAITLASYITLGIVVGMALTILTLTFI